MLESATSTFLKATPIVLALGVLVGLGGRKLVRYLLNSNGMVVPPFSKKQHDELCVKNLLIIETKVNARMDVTDGKIESIGREISHIRKHLDGGG